MEKVLITGISGYIGTALAGQLLEQGYRVCGLSRRFPQYLQHPERVAWVEGSILDPAVVQRAMEGCTCVFHLAAYVHPWARDRNLYYRVHVDGSRTVLEKAQECGVDRLICTSTAGVLNPSHGREAVTEDSSRVIPYDTEYERTKAEAEQLLLQAAAPGEGPEIIVLNPSRVYGPGAPAVSNGVTKMIWLYLKGRYRFLPGDGRSTGNYVHVDDVVQGHMLAMHKGKSGQRYILGGENADFRTFFRILAEVSGIRRKMIPLPMWSLILASHGMLLWTALSGKSPPISPEFLRKYRRHWSVSSDLARKELGYNPISLEEGLRKTLQQGRVLWA